MNHNWLHTPDCEASNKIMNVQIMLYFLWGNVLCAGSLSFSAICRQARPAVLVAVIWVIMSGFGANLVLTQFIEQGPSIAATILQIIPSMGLFRGKSQSQCERQGLSCTYRAHHQLESIGVVAGFWFHFISFFTLCLYYLSIHLCPLVALVGLSGGLSNVTACNAYTTQSAKPTWP